MAKTRQTVQVTPLIQWANLQLKRTDEDATIDFKKGICSMIEYTLQAANRYNGFTFINSHLHDDIPHGSMEYWSRNYFL